MICTIFLKSSLLTNNLIESFYLIKTKSFSYSQVSIVNISCCCLDHLLWGEEDSSKVDVCIRIAVEGSGSFCPDLKVERKWILIKSAEKSYSSINCSKHYSTVLSYGWILVGLKNTCCIFACCMQQKRRLSLTLWPASICMMAVPVIVE